MEEMAEKRVKDSETEQSYLLMHRHINGYGRLFGGQLVAWIDELAGLVGRRHCGHEITTACIDNLNFKHPAFLNDTVVLVGRVTYVGRTSMEVRVDTYVEELATGIRKMINRAYVVMVAIDENGQVLARETFRPIPGLFAAGNTAGSRFGIQYTTALCGVSIAFAVTQGKFTGEYVASLA